MQSYFSKTLFYSLLFAIGGAPTLAMWIIRLQMSDPAMWWYPFVGLSFILASILAPIILIQNAFLFWKRRQVDLEQKLRPVCHTYLILNVFCLISWLYFQW